MSNKNISISFAPDFKSLASMVIDGREFLYKTQKPLFTVGLRTRNAEEVVFNAADAKIVKDSYENGKFTLTYDGFDAADVTVTVSCTVADALLWRVAVENRTDSAVEYVDIPSVTLEGALVLNGGKAGVILPYNEGMLIENCKHKSKFMDPEFPSHPRTPMFPNMLFAPLAIYMYENNGIYMGAHDPGRGTKCFDFCSDEEKTEFKIKLYMGANFGESVATDYDLVFKYFEDGWQNGAEYYREWFENNLPEGLKKIEDNPALPAWYTDDMPLVITYPVRGVHDMDKMDPNGMFPYENALPYIDEYAKKIGTKVMVLLMHWEGTAPWAPPYVWPPFGGEKMLLDFMDKLHASGHLLGVYCSGISYTDQSNLIEEYNCAKQIEERGHMKAFCAAPDQSIKYSIVCTGQRSAYEICAATDLGAEIMKEALDPMFQSGIDYVQVLDQNHGGGMAFCYSKSHGHPPVPGKWMTDAQVKLLKGWKDSAPNVLIGCESAASEPFLSSLSLSDNRYVFNYEFGRPQPIYAYIYHEYLHNFMGNQCCCPIIRENVGWYYRAAYAFIAGDLLTLILNDKGDIQYNWGLRDFSLMPDHDDTVELFAEMRRWHREYPRLFKDGRMIHPIDYKCDIIEIKFDDGSDQLLEPCIMSSAWYSEGKKVQLFINYTEDARDLSLTLPENATLRRSLAESEKVSGELNIKMAPRSIIAVEF